MSTEPNLSSSTTGADAIDVAIAQGIDFDGSAIPPAKLDLYTLFLLAEPKYVSCTRLAEILEELSHDSVNSDLAPFSISPIR